MKKIVFLLILLIWASHSFNAYQMRNANSVDTERMQRYVEHINATNQLNVYDRR